MSKRNGNTVHVKSFTDSPKPDDDLEQRIEGNRTYPNDPPRFTFDERMSFVVGLFLGGVLGAAIVALIKA